MRHLYFVRHGQTEWNAIHRMQGQQDSVLSARGRCQAEATGRLLAGLGIDALFASPLGRARQTARILQRHLRIEPAYDERLKEWDCGDWSGHLYEDVKRKWPDEWAALEADRFNYRGPNCENYPDMIARAAPFLSEVVAAVGTRNVAIVSHGMIGRVMIGILMELDAARMLSFTQPNDVVYRVRLPSGLAGERELHHYAGGAGPIQGYVRAAPR